MNWSAGWRYFQNNLAGIYSQSEYQSPQTSHISPLILEKNVFLHFMLPDCAWFLLICFLELKLRNFNSFFALQKGFIHTKGFYSYKELCRIPLCCSSSVSVGTFFALWSQCLLAFVEGNVVQDNLVARLQYGSQWVFIGTPGNYAFMWSPSTLNNIKYHEHNGVCLLGLCHKG